MRAAVALALLAAAAALPAAAARQRSKAQHPLRWFATRAGLIRVYQAKAEPAEGHDRAGASCEVVDATPPGADAVQRTRELCMMISDKKPKPATQLTYELRSEGIFLVRTEVAGQKPFTAERLLLPAPVRAGTSWRETGRGSSFHKRIKSAGQPCKAAGFRFADCLVVSVTQKTPSKRPRRFTETYAAGVGLVEDSAWQLLDLKGL